jgi:formate hydrogenlyase transcriptional activator
VKEFARRMGKPIRLIPPETMAALILYAWPGNIRELQNLIERAVIRSNNGVLPNPLPMFAQTPLSPQEGKSPSPLSGTLRDCMRSLILQTLADTGWVIGGPDGAAVRLGLPRTSLISKMKKLGISRRRGTNLTDIIAENSDTEIRQQSAPQ